MKIREGRKNTSTHYIEVRLESPRLNVVAQKSGTAWVLYLVWPGRNSPVRTLSKYYHDLENAKNAAISIGQGLEGFMNVYGSNKKREKIKELQILMSRARSR